MLVAAFAPAGAAAHHAGLMLTVVARHCPAYTDISPNLQRNNIMESLQDLRPGSSPYKSGELMDPGIEQREQPKCEPLENWTFTLGDGYKTKAKAGPWGALSIVLRPFETDLTTKAETDLLNPQGLPTGKKVQGAATIHLSKEQAGLAAGQNLWIQGGTPEDPILNGRFPGPKYGFGALRCAVDDLNGDNVEYIAYPDGVTHVFCFAYYVEPPPTSGTIVIRKEVGSPPPGLGETFAFGGSTSYNPNGRFDLHVTATRPVAEERFFRGATGPTNPQPWTVRELEIATWRLAGLSCTSRDGSSQFDVSIASAEAKIALGAGDLATCTFVNEYAPPPQGLDIRKVTLGGVGHFSYTVTPVGGGAPAHAEVTTTKEGLATDAVPLTIDLPAGRYEVTESMPSSSAGRWSLDAVECNGERRPASQPVEITIPKGGLLACTFTNVFVPRGSITISKVTRGGVGPSSFVVYRQGGDLAEYAQSVTTDQPGVAKNAHGDSTEDLELGDYKIIDFPPPPGRGEWSLAYVQCDGRAVPFAQGRIDISLTARDSHRHCTFVNSFDATPLPKPEGPQPVSPRADLLVTKQAPTQAQTVGGIVEYRLAVANRGASLAGNVRVIDQPLGRSTLVSARPSSGRCRLRLPLVCRLGDVRPGRRKSVDVRLQVWRPGLFLNQAVAGTSTRTVRLKRARDRARVRVKGIRRVFPVFPGLG